LYCVASSQQIQFHRANVGDSRAVVTPFVQDGTYPSRDFATLGPSGLWPPFIGASKKKREHFFFSHDNTGQESDSIHHNKI